MNMCQPLTILVPLLFNPCLDVLLAKPIRASSRSRSDCERITRILTYHNENLVSRFNIGKSYFIDAMPTINLLTKALIPLVSRIDRQSKLDQPTNHRSRHIFTWKTLQCKEKIHGHQLDQTFTIMWSGYRTPSLDDGLQEE
jgi:hypothetical protein